MSNSDILKFTKIILKQKVIIGPLNNRTTLVLEIGEGMKTKTNFITYLFTGLC